MKKATTTNMRKETNGNGVYLIYSPRKKLYYVGRGSNGDVKHNLRQHFDSKKYSGAKLPGKRDKYFYEIIKVPKKSVKCVEKTLIRELNPKLNKYKYRRKKKNEKFINIKK